MPDAPLTPQPGPFGIPSLVVGVVGSGAAHAAVLAALVALPVPASSVERTAAQPNIARGEPILVRLVEPVEAVVEVEPPDEPPPPVTPSDPTDDEIAPPPVAVAVVEPEPAPPPPTPGRAVGRTYAGWLARMPVDALPVAAPVEETPPVEEPPPVETVAAVEPAPAVTRPAPDRPAARPATPPPTPTPPAPVPEPSGVETGAEVLHTPRPVYPRRSIRRGEEGTALVAIEVLADGRTGRIELRESSGHRRLDDAALDAAGRCRFRPATRDGRPVDSTVLVPFEFELK